MNNLRLSKFLSLVLRHDPASIGITLDSQGWVNCSDLIAASIAHGMTLDQQTLQKIVSDSDKQRFAFNDDGTRIRANQGHSVTVDLGLVARTPPDELFHGTVERFLDLILKEGLHKGQRHQFHLSPDPLTANKVGTRRGEPVILRIDAARMAADGFDFYRSENGVWLADHVPPQFIGLLPEVTTLYRPVGPEELKLIEASGWKAFPPRLPDQPIFYPVTNEPYAIQIARDWNVKASGSGYVTRFEVATDYLMKFPIQTVGGTQHTELWVPAEELAEFNRNIIGPIEVIHRFPEKPVQ